MTGPAQVLYDLMLTFVETAHPIELKWKTTDIEDTVEPGTPAVPWAKRFALRVKTEFGL